MRLERVGIINISFVYFVFCFSSLQCCCCSLLRRLFRRPLRDFFLLLCTCMSRRFSPSHVQVCILLCMRSVDIYRAHLFLVSVCLCVLTLVLYLNNVFTLAEEWRIYRNLENMYTINKLHLDLGCRSILYFYPLFIPLFVLFVLCIGALYIYFILRVRSFAFVFK